MWKKGNSLTLLLGTQTGAATVEDSVEVPQKIKNRAALQSSNHTTGDLPKEYKNTNLKGYMQHCLLQHYLQQPNYGSSPSVHQQMNG